MRSFLVKGLFKLVAGLTAASLLAGCGALPSYLLPPTPIPTKVVPTHTPRPSSTPLPTADMSAKPTQPGKSTKTPTAVPSPTETPFQGKATIKIAIALPLTGDSGAAGTSLYNGAKLAASQLQGPLNDAGYGVQLVAFDDKHDVDTAVQNTAQFASDPAFLCGLGNYNANVMIQAEDLYHAAALAFINPNLNTPGITEKHYPEINRLVGRTDGEGTAAAQFAKAKGFKTSYIISVSNQDGKKNASEFLTAATEIGLKVDGSTISNLTEGFTTVLSQIDFMKPDVIYFPGSTTALGNLIHEARTAGYTGAFIGSENANTPTFADAAGPLALDGGGTFFTSTYAPISAYPDATQFAADYLQAYGSKPPMSPFAAQAYDAVGICLKAIEVGVERNNGDLPTRKEVVSNIRALQNYDGITGTYTFNLRGDPLLVDYFVYQLISSDPKKWSANPLVGTFRTLPPL